MKQITQSVSALQIRHRSDKKKAEGKPYDEKRAANLISLRLTWYFGYESHYKAFLTAALISRYRFT